MFKYIKSATLFPILLYKMGNNFIDQYSFLHFSVGAIIYFWGINLPVWIFLHLLFEYMENTSHGIYFINKYMFFWPGGKPRADSFVNILGDNISGILGWVVAKYIDNLGVRMGWYSTAHIIA